MSRQPRFCPRWKSLGREDRAAQIVEFAVALPLLVVFVVGIFDFSGAFTLKQKLTNAARDAARAAAADPFNDICSSCAGLPVSVTDAFYSIDNYLIANQINDCGIGTGSAAYTSPSTWKFSASGSPTNGCPTAGLTIIINRGYFYPSTGSVTAPPVACRPGQSATGTMAVISTCVSIQYGYQWKFGQAASLLSATPFLPNPISAVAIAMNEN